MGSKRAWLAAVVCLLVLGAGACTEDPEDEGTGSASGVDDSSAQEVELLEELLLRKRARRSYADFCRYIAPDEPPGKHHLLVCEAGDRIVAGTLNRVLIMMPPGSAKSTYATVRLPPYILGRLGKKGVITASWGDELAEMP